LTHEERSPGEVVVGYDNVPSRSRISLATYNARVDAGIIAKHPGGALDVVRTELEFVESDTQHIAYTAKSEDVSSVRDMIVARKLPGRLPRNTGIFVRIHGERETKSPSGGLTIRKFTFQTDVWSSTRDTVWAYRELIRRMTEEELYERNTTYTVHTVAVVFRIGS
jgi:hypothetical protein